MHYIPSTAAIRQSKNREAIIKEIKQDIHIEIQIVPEEDEAFYGLCDYILPILKMEFLSISVAVLPKLPFSKISNLKSLTAFHSAWYQASVLVIKNIMTKQPLKYGTVLREQFSQLDWLSNQHIALVGVGGSARNVARIHQSAHAYPIGGVHNYTMTSKDINNVYDLIRKSSRDELTNQTV